MQDFKIRELSDLLRIANEDEIRISSMSHLFVKDYCAELENLVMRKVGKGKLRKQA